MDYSRLYLLEGVPLNMNHEHTIDFANAESQFNFFQSYKNTIIDDDDYSWIRDNIIKVNVNIDDIRSCNYIMFNNKSKWYYAFITSKEYVNQNNTQINFVIDVMQTFMFDYTIGETFVEREHQDRYYYENNKLHPIFSRTRENLERGDEMMRTKTEVLYDERKPSNCTFDITWLTVITKEKLSNQYYDTNGLLNIERVLPTTFNGVYNNIYAYAVPVIYNQPTQEGFYHFYFNCELKRSNTSIANVSMMTPDAIYVLSKDPKVISITESKYAPFDYTWKYTDTPGASTSINRTFTLTVESDNPYGDRTYAISSYENTANKNAMFFIINHSATQPPTSSINTDFSIDADLSIDNQKSIEYEPKLLTQDYQYKLLTYGNNEVKILNENCFNNQIYVDFVNPFSAKLSQSMQLSNYNTNDVDNIEQSIYNDGFMFELPLLTDAWLEYLQNNKNALQTGMATGAISTVGSLAIGALTGGLGLAVTASTALSYFTQVANQMAQIKDLKEKPDEIKNVTNDICIEMIKGMELKLKTYEIYNQFKNKIFNYFYHFGYIANEFITPNLKSRYYFNYIKTIGCNIQSSIDNEYVSELRNIFDNGITIWHYRDDSTWKGVGEYNYENVETSIMEVTSND